jgi:hypothetical protein
MYRVIGLSQRSYWRIQGKQKNLDKGIAEIITEWCENISPLTRAGRADEAVEILEEEIHFTLPNVFFYCAWRIWHQVAPSQLSE